MTTRNPSTCCHVTTLWRHTGPPTWAILEEFSAAGVRLLQRVVVPSPNAVPDNCRLAMSSTSMNLWVTELLTAAEMHFCQATRRTGQSWRWVWRFKCLNFLHRHIHISVTKSFRSFPFSPPCLARPLRQSTSLGLYTLFELFDWGVFGPTSSPLKILARPIHLYPRYKQLFWQECLWESFWHTDHGSNWEWSWPSEIRLCFRLRFPDS